MGKLMRNHEQALGMLRSKTDEFNQYDIDDLNENGINYLEDNNSVFIKTSDGVLVIPCGISYCSKGYYCKVLELDYWYLAHDKVDLISQKIEHYKKLISLLETK